MEGQDFRFQVDTGLFRELGELLVGRDSTALMELVKNAYDADATSVTLKAEGLTAPGGWISISDDGIGMTADEFNEGFLTIAGRSRLAGTRTSTKFGRRFSGAKGVGRLAAHKLSSQLHVRTQADSEIRGRKRRYPSVEANIDWNEIEQYTTIDAVISGIEVVTGGSSSDAGTTIELRKLRRKWTQNEINRFLAELEGFRLPTLLTANPAPSLIGETLLFGEPTVATRGADDPGFDLTTSGDFAVGEDLWAEMGQQMSWVIEVDATSQQVEVAIAPTTRHLETRQTSAKRVDARFDHPVPNNGPFFVARIFVREQAFRGALRDFARRSSGIRFYHEGFRVLPYGEPTDDWLGLDREYVSKPRTFDIEPSSSDEELKARAKEGYYSLGNPQYVGAVFTTQERAGGLEMVVSREGFVPNESFDAVQSIVRNAVHLSVRTRAAVGARDAELAKRDKPTTPANRDNNSSEPPAIDETLAAARAKAEDIASNAPDGDIAVDDAKHLADLTLGLASEIDRLRDEQALTRVLASVGSELASFVHELNGIVSQAQTVRLLAGQLDEFDLGDAKPTYQHLNAAVEELVGLLSRQSSYIVDVLGVDARGRRSPQRIARRLRSVLDSLAPAASSRQVTIEVDVDDAVRSPAMYPAEVTILMRNLLTNAIKAAGTPGRVYVEAKAEGQPKITSIRVQNSGKTVDLRDSDRWFSAFESTTTEIDPLLGQGMGLGLTIVRATVNDYGGSVSFVPPDRGFRTAIQIDLPHRAIKRSATKT